MGRDLSLSGCLVSGPLVNSSWEARKLETINFARLQLQTTEHPVDRWKLLRPSAKLLLDYHRNLFL